MAVDRMAEAHDRAGKKEDGGPPKPYNWAEEACGQLGLAYGPGGESLTGPAQPVGVSERQSRLGLCGALLGPA